MDYVGLESHGHGFHLSSGVLISAGVQRSVVLLTTQDEISFLLTIIKKEIKTHLVFDCLSKFTFGQGFTQLINESYFHLYHTCVKKSIGYARRSLSGLEA